MFWNKRTKCILYILYYPFSYRIHSDQPPLADCSLKSNFHLLSPLLNFDLILYYQGSLDKHSLCDFYLFNFADSLCKLLSIQQITK